MANNCHTCSNRNQAKPAGAAPGVSVLPTTPGVSVFPSLARTAGANEREMLNARHTNKRFMGGLLSFKDHLRGQSSTRV
jgi:hypothetical protein